MPYPLTGNGSGESTRWPMHPESARNRKEHGPGYKEDIWKKTVVFAVGILSRRGCKYAPPAWLLPGWIASMYGFSMGLLMGNW